MNKIIIAHTVQKVTGQFAVRAWVEMPLGAEPFGVTRHGEGLAILAVEDFEGVTVDFPLFIFPVGHPTEMPLGAKVGAFIGTVIMDGQPVCIFRGSPWPASVLVLTKRDDHSE